jgi:hypothetical protein
MYPRPSSPAREGTRFLLRGSHLSPLLKLDTDPAITALILAERVLQLCIIDAAVVHAGANRRRYGTIGIATGSRRLNASVDVRERPIIARRQRKLVLNPAGHRQTIIDFRVDTVCLSGGHAIRRANTGVCTRINPVRRDIGHCLYRIIVFPPLL